MLPALCSADLIPMSISTKYFLFLFLACQFIRAQDKPYIVGPNMYGMEYVSKSGMKSVVILTRINLCGRASNDTISKYAYNRLGQRTKTVSYENNYVRHTTTSTFDKSNNVKQHYTEYPKDKRISLITMGYKNNKENWVGNYDYKTGKPDTLGGNVNRKTFNAKGKLVEENMRSGLVKTYAYDKNGNNTKLKVVLMNGVTTTYFHYTDNLLRESETYRKSTIKPNDSTLYSKYRYTYNDKKQLVAEKYIGYDNAPEQENVYQYNSDGKLSHMELKKQNDFLNIDYEYKDGKIIGNKATGNQAIKFSTEYPLLMGLGFCPNLGSEFKYELIYTYDRKGNLTKMDRYLNGELKISTEYIITYY
jgi:hypothetical protein